MYGTHQAPRPGKAMPSSWNQPAIEYPQYQVQNRQPESYQTSSNSSHHPRRNEPHPHYVQPSSSGGQYKVEPHRQYKVQKREPYHRHQQSGRHDLSRRLVVPTQKSTFIRTELDNAAAYRSKHEQETRVKSREDSGVYMGGYPTHLQREKPLPRIPVTQKYLDHKFLPSLPQQVSASKSRNVHDLTISTQGKLHSSPKVEYCTATSIIPKSASWRQRLNATAGKMFGPLLISRQRRGSDSSFVCQGVSPSQVTNALQYFEKNRRPVVLPTQSVPITLPPLPQHRRHPQTRTATRCPPPPTQSYQPAARLHVFQSAQHAVPLPPPSSTAPVEIAARQRHRMQQPQMMTPQQDGRGCGVYNSHKFESMQSDYKPAPLFSGSKGIKPELKGRWI